MLEEGSKAFDFTLYNSEDKPITLSHFKGKKIVLYFYPKDNTPGCTKQACAFAQKYHEFEERDVIVIGVSKDTIASHEKFARKHNLPFMLISDPDLVVIKGYDVWKEKKLYGKSFMGVMRSTYLINEEGIIIKAIEKASPTNNANDILALLDTM